jgi:hypothetical protein
MFFQPAEAVDHPRIPVRATLHDLSPQGIRRGGGHQTALRQTTILFFLLMEQPAPIPGSGIFPALVRKPGKESFSPRTFQAERRRHDKNRGPPKWDIPKS